MVRSRTQQLVLARRVRLIAMDVDGVLTNGDVTVLNSGEEVKTWNAKDRLLIALLRDANAPLVLAWITGRQSSRWSTPRRTWACRYLVQKCADKKAAMATILEKENLTLDASRVHRGRSYRPAGDARVRFFGVPVGRRARRSAARPITYRRGRRWPRGGARRVGIHPSGAKSMGRAALAFFALIVLIAAGCAARRPVFGAGVATAAGRAKAI